MSEHAVHETARIWLMSLLSILVSNLQLALGLTLMAVNIGYTVWKWRRDYVNDKRNANK